MKAHILTPSCWCIPIIVQICLECFDKDHKEYKTEQDDKICWQCGGTHFVNVYDENNTSSIILFHNPTETEAMEKGKSLYSNYIINGVGWDNVMEYFTRHGYKSI